MNKIKVINLRDVSEEEFENYSIRNSVRGILLDREGKIGTVYVKEHDVYQLVGGGMEEGETIEEALKREAKEEAGVDIKIISEIGLIVEIIKEETKVQNSYCYIFEVVGEKGETNYTKKETERGFEIQWMDIKRFEEEIERIKFRIPVGEYSYIRTKTVLEEFFKKK